MIKAHSYMKNSTHSSKKSLNCLLISSIGTCNNSLTHFIMNVINVLLSDGLLSDGSLLQKRNNKMYQETSKHKLDIIYEH